MKQRYRYTPEPAPALEEGFESMASPVAEQIDAHIAKRQALVKQLNALMTAAAETSRGLTADEAKEHDLILEQLDAMDEHAKRFARWITGF